jgi:hypothetical protein
MKKVKVGKSKIHGNGLIADEPIKRGDVIELVHTIREIKPGVTKTTPTLLGRNYNHSDDANALNVIDGNNRYLVALKEIEVGGEITANYRTNPDLEQPESFTSNDNYISFDYDDTLTTPEGFKLAKKLNEEGNNLYVITARDKITPQMIERAEAAGIPKENIITAGSDEAKVKIVKENNISKHIDNKESVIKALGDAGELFTPDKYPDLKADFVEMDLSDDDLNKLKEGGFIVEEYPDGGIISQEEIDAGNRAMMKARLAYADMHGNPAAQRMVVAPDQPYDFGDGMTGTHYMASMDNYAVPQIQDINGQLMLGDYGPDSAEAIRFDNPEDANYFAENYKQVTPDASYRQEEYSKGGDPGKGKKGKKSKGVQPFVTSDPKEYAYRKAAYDDSLTIFKLNNEFTDAKRVADDNARGRIRSKHNSPSDGHQAWDEFEAQRAYWESRKNNPLLQNVVNKPTRPTPYFKTYGQNVLPRFSFDRPVQRVKFVEPTSNKPKSKVNSKTIIKPTPIITKEVIPSTPVTEQVIPIPTPIPASSPIILPTSPIPLTEYPGIMPQYNIDEAPMYATPDPDAEWIGQTERYIDWDANRIPYRLPRFRQPGHGGDLIKPGKRRYIPIPGIETRNSAYIQREDEEYQDGGESKRKKYRFIKDTEEAKQFPVDEWGQYIQEEPDVVVRPLTPEQQQERNMEWARREMARRNPHLYLPNGTLRPQAAQSANWVFAAPMVAPMALEALGSVAATQIPGTGVSLGTVANTAAGIHGATQVPQRIQDWQDVAAGKKDWKEATAESIMTGLELYGGLSELKGFKGVPKELPGSPNSSLELGKASRTIYPQPITNSVGLKQFGQTTYSGPVSVNRTFKGDIYSIKNVRNPEGIPEEQIPYLLGREELMRRYPTDYMSKDELIGYNFKSGLKPVEYPTEIPANFTTQEDIMARILGKPLPSRVKPKVYYDIEGTPISEEEAIKILNTREYAYGGFVNRSKLNRFIK